jgi:phage baseplate assembly protein W
MAYERIAINSFIPQSNTAYGIGLTFNNSAVFIALYDELRQAYENLKRLLITVPGERIYYPGYGCSLGSLVFEPNTDDIKEEVNSSIISAITTWLPELDILSIEVQTHEDNPSSPHDLQITLQTALNGLSLNPVKIFVNENGIQTV